MTDNQTTNTIRAELNASHERAIERVLQRFNNDPRALAAEIVRLRMELMVADA